MAYKSLFITCVSPDQAHPSGRLAEQYLAAGFYVETLFADARSLKCISRDSVMLIKLLNSRRFTSAVVNVNGSLAQAIVVAFCRWKNVSTTLWIMDSYPGCLRYVTHMWPMLYPFFFISAFFAKCLAKKVLIIDEAFALYAPTWDGFRKKCLYFPLPQDQSTASAEENEPVLAHKAETRTIGLVGNIEERWLKNDFESFYRDARERDLNIIVATAKVADRKKFQLAGVECVIPWPKAETDRVFSKCSAILVPLSSARLIYSSPSKIIDCYRRGIQPIVMVGEKDWNRCKKRNIYAMCILYSDFLSGKDSHSASSLIAYSKLWERVFSPLNVA